MSNDTQPESTDDHPVRVPRVVDAVHYDADGVWYPLRRDGGWLDDEYWGQNLSVLRNQSDGTRALAALREVFTARWAQKQRWKRDLRATESVHPIVHDGMTIGGRHRLLELGAMLSKMDEKKRLRDRLLPQREYYGTCAELRSGLLLRTARARVEWEPVRDGSGPDWLAHWDAGSLAVEVKRPQRSARAEALQRIEIAFNVEFTRALSDPPLRPSTGVWLTLHLSPTILDNKTALGSIDMQAILALARHAAEAVRSNFPAPAAPGRFSAGAAGDFTVRLRDGEKPHVQTTMECLPGDKDHQVLRVFETIRDAASQLDAVKETPGLIILDADGNFGLLNLLDDIHETLLTEPWAQGLAGVAVVTKTSTVDDEQGAWRIDGRVRIVPGLKVAALNDTLLPGLRVCDRDHFHFDPLLAPSRRCESIW